MLVQAAAKDLHRRNVRAMEAFGRSVPVRRRCGGCVLPAAFLSEVGFKTVREHAVWPRMRLDLRTVLSWREDVEAASSGCCSRCVSRRSARGRDSSSRTGRTTPPGAGADRARRAVRRRPEASQRLRRAAACQPSRVAQPVRDSR